MEKKITAKFKGAIEKSKSATLKYIALNTGYFIFIAGIYITKLIAFVFTIHKSKHI